MPITVIVRSTVGDESRLTFDGTQRVVVGRGAGNDVRVPDASVSHRHASVRSQGMEFIVVDEGSTNGTFVGEVRVAPRMSRIVRSGDWVRVGRVWLRLLMDPSPVTRDLAMATRDLALELVSQAMKARGADRTTAVRVVEGQDQGATLRLTDAGRTYVIGRGVHCELALGDEDVSREHVHVVQRDATVFVQDLGAKNGTWLGEAPVGRDQEVIWRPTLMLRVGRSVLALAEPVAMALAEIEKAEDEPMSPAEMVGTSGPPDQAPQLSAPEQAMVSALRAASVASPGGRVATSEKGGRRSTWSVLDLLVMGAALGVLALSLAGIFWLLRG